MDGIATAACMPYARPMDGTRVRRKGFLKFVAWRRRRNRDGMLRTWPSQTRGRRKRREGVAGPTYSELSIYLWQAFAFLKSKS